VPWEASVTTDQKLYQAPQYNSNCHVGRGLVTNLARPGGNVTECLGRWQSKRANDWSCSRGYPQVFRWRVRSEQSGRSRSELPMMVGTASTREFARRLRPVLALSGCANRACPRLLSMENGKTFARSEPFRF